MTLPPRMELIDLKNCPPDEAPLGRATARTGKAAGEALEFAVRMAQNGDLEAIVYAPLHKRALHEAGYGFDDELHLLAHWLECGEFGEINVLDRLWTSRVTSHIGLARVAEELSVERVLAAIRLIHRERRRSGTLMPLIAVAALKGQIAMKLMGFERGVTLAGGLPVPIATPAHGTAHDIAGRGTANPGAFQAALDLVVRMVTA
ncbi:MAG TPA: 4-hydroxythreonine-4-phosphate dehydrogenase PdxA [Methylomirabilota bacterium]|nr:4-hydroxythreonine-4-phosphate dehydrogenase PdxA [Methylomirabilota bacterium]